MKEPIRFLSKTFAGHGHYKVTVDIGQKITCLTTNMPAVDNNDHKALTEECLIAHGLDPDDYDMNSVINPID